MDELFTKFDTMIDYPKKMYVPSLANNRDKGKVDLPPLSSHRRFWTFLSIHRLPNQHIHQQYILEQPTTATPYPGQQMDHFQPYRQHSNDFHMLEQTMFHRDNWAATP